MKRLLLLPLVFIALCAFDSSAQSRESIIGCWDMPGNATEQMQLKRDGEFTFHDYNAKTKTWDDLTGKWDYKGGKLTLLYYDRPKQTFTVKKTGNTMSLTKTGFKMMKTNASNCGM